MLVPVIVSLSQIDLFENYWYYIEILAAISLYKLFVLR